MDLPSIDRLDRINDQTLARFHAALGERGFGMKTIDEIDGIAPSAPGPVRLPLVRAELRERTEPAMRLALLLTYGGALAREEAERLLDPATVGELLDAGFLLAIKAQVHCPFRVVPSEGCWVLSDDVLDQPDSVMPPGPTTDKIVGIMPKRFEGSVFDVGCGPGSLALIAAARGARRVFGIDINARAIVMAKFNARWNRLGAEFRQGDLLEPAGGERFDLVVAQPPFLTLPPHVTEIRFLHGGPRGDAHLLRLLRGLAGCLAPQGEALVLSDVMLRKDEDLGDYVRDEVGPCGLDLLALHLAGPSLDTHVMRYAQFGNHDTGRELFEELRRHRAHFESLGIESLRHALFVARPRGAGAPVTTPIAVRDIGVATPEVRARLWASARGANASDHALARSRVRVAPDALWVSLRHAPEGEQFEHRLRFGDGWPALEQIVTDEGLTLASLLERSSSVEEAVAGYAELCDATPGEVRAPLLTYIRQSLLTGMFVFEEC